jgi:cyclase
MTTRNTITRREWLTRGVHVAGAAAAVHFLAPSDLTAAAMEFWQQAKPTADALTQSRLGMAAVPIQSVPLASGLQMLAGPGGNVVLSTGADGKLVVDTFVQPAWPKLKAVLDAQDKTPIKMVVNTHWHFDHADNNASFRQAGAVLVAHANTPRRMAETHDLLGMHFEPSPPAARPTETFTDHHTLTVNGESIELSYIPPSHTDTDIAVRFTKANVLHLGDVYFAGVYPFFDTSTGGNINGMIAAADVGLQLADGATKIVPGHGPLSDRVNLMKYRDMLTTVRDRVRKLKTSGRSLQDTLAAKPSADLDPTWGKGFMQPNDFVTLVYNTV